MEPVTENSACFFTQQVFLIGTYDTDGSPHFAPISWISFTAGPPACLVTSMSNNPKKRTIANVERTGLLSATVVTPDLLPFAEQHNRATQREGAETTLAFERGRRLNVPLIAGAKWSYECEVFKTVSVGDCITYFADFKHVNVRTDVQALDFYDLRAINPVIYSPFHYFTVGGHLGAIGDYSKG